MFVSIRRKKTAGRVYEYVDIVENRKVDGRVKHHRLGTLGRRDQLSPQKIDALIGHLRKLASPEGLRGISLVDMRIFAVREYDVPLVLSRLWQEFGLDQLLDAIPQTKRVPVAEAVFRMVVNRLCDPQSKLGLVDWTDEQGVVHRGWQGKVQWPTEAAIDYHQYLLAMDRVHPHRERIEEALFDRTTNLLSLPLRLCFYDLTSTYFEGDGACELAQYGYSRDHRDDRSQIVVGLAVTQEGLPITHRVYPGATVDVTTFVPMVEELRKRFGLQEAVIVADRGMFSADNIAEMTLAGQRYILALRARQQAEGELALDLAELEKLPRPKDVNAPWERREVKLIDGVRHIVVYSAFKAQHDFEVRARRIRRALSELHQFKERAEKDKLSMQPITERVARILAQHKCARYFVYEIREGRLDFRISRAEYRHQRRHDGILSFPSLDPTCEVLVSLAVTRTRLDRRTPLDPWSFRTAPQVVGKPVI